VFTTSREYAVKRPLSCHHSTAVAASNDVL